MMTNTPGWFSNATEFSPQIDFIFELPDKIVHYHDEPSGRITTTEVGDLPVVGDGPGPCELSSALAWERKERLLNYYKQFALLCAEERHKPVFSPRLRIAAPETVDPPAFGFLLNETYPAQAEHLKLWSGGQNGLLHDGYTQIYADDDWIYVYEDTHAGYEEAGRTYHKMKRSVFAERAKASWERTDKLIGWLSENFGGDYWNTLDRINLWPDWVYDAVKERKKLKNKGERHARDGICKGDGRQ